VAWNVIMAAPSGKSTNSSIGSVGAMAAPIRNAPKAMPAIASNRWLGRARLADTSAPTNAPAPMKDIRSPKVPAPELNTNLAISGMSTEKLKASVPTTSISRSGNRSSGLFHA